MSERACGIHALDSGVNESCLYCTQARIKARDAEIERLRQELAEARAECAELRTVQWYWDDNDLDHAYPADEACEGYDVGDIVELRPIHELPSVFALATEEGVAFYATAEEAEAAAAAGGEG